MLILCAEGTTEREPGRIIREAMVKRMLPKWARVWLRSLLGRGCHVFERSSRDCDCARCRACYQVSVFYVEVETRETVCMEIIGRAVERAVKETSTERDTWSTLAMVMQGHQSAAGVGRNRTCAFVWTDTRCVGSRLEEEVRKTLSLWQPREAGGVVVDTGGYGPPGEQVDESVFWTWIGSRFERASPHTVPRGANRFVVSNQNASKGVMSIEAPLFNTGKRQSDGLGSCGKLDAKFWQFEI